MAVLPPRYLNKFNRSGRFFRYSYHETTTQIRYVKNLISLDKSIVIELRMERRGRCFNIVTITSVNLHRMYVPTNTVTCYFQSVTFKGIWYIIRQIQALNARIPRANK